MCLCMCVCLCVRVCVCVHACVRTGVNVGIFIGVWSHRRIVNDSYRCAVSFHYAPYIIALGEFLLLLCCSSTLYLSCVMLQGLAELILRSRWFIDVCHVFHYWPFTIGCVCVCVHVCVYVCVCTCVWCV